MKKAHMMIVAIVFSLSSTVFAAGDPPPDIFPTIYKQLKKELPDHYHESMSDLLVHPVEKDGIVFSTLQDGLNQLALTGSSAEGYIKEDKVRDLMTLLAKTATWAKLEVGPNISESQVASESGDDYIHKLVNERFKKISATRMPYNLSGTCRFNQRYTLIQCGACTLDMLATSGTTELYCAGMSHPVFPPKVFPRPNPRKKKK